MYRARHTLQNKPSYYASPNNARAVSKEVWGFVLHANRNNKEYSRSDSRVSILVDNLIGEMNRMKPSFNPTHWCDNALKMVGLCDVGLTTPITELRDHLAYCWTSAISTKYTTRKQKRQW